MTVASGAQRGRGLFYDDFNVRGVLLDQRSGELHHHHRVAQQRLQRGALFLLDGVDQQVVD